MSMLVVPVNDPLQTPRLRVVAATIALNVLVVALLTTAPWSDWRTGLALNLFDNCLLLAFVWWRRDASLARLMVFGLGVGLAELPADAWLVDYTRTLDYSIGGGPMLWRSPLWMPLAWQIVAVQFGCVGLWLWDRFGGAGLGAIGLLGAVNIPYYEEMARRIHWWQYRDCRMLAGTPYYIIVGECVIAVMLAVLAKSLRHGSWSSTAGAGALGGLAIFPAYALAYAVTDGFLRR